MPSAIASETRPDLLETVQSLPVEGQNAVLNFALFLRQQEDRRRIDSDEAEWDRLFNNPVKMANFAKWADALFATQTAEPFDESKL